MKTVYMYAFMFDGPKRAGTKLIRLASWIGRATSVIPGGQQVVAKISRRIIRFESYQNSLFDVFLKFSLTLKLGNQKQTSARGTYVRTS